MALPNTATSTPASAYSGFANRGVATGVSSSSGSNSNSSSSNSSYGSKAPQSFANNTYASFAQGGAAGRGGRRRFAASDQFKRQLGLLSNANTNGRGVV
jgi:hypothetical protein